MMRLVVFSDSHGYRISLETAIKNEPDADAFVFLGDGLREWEDCQELIKNKISVAVKGNCDGMFPPYPKKVVGKFGQITTYCTHGDNEQVKFSLEPLKLNASLSEATLVLFGHTHTPYKEYDNGLYLFNPGSVKQNSYGIVDITENGIMCFHKKIIPQY